MWGLTFQSLVENTCMTSSFMKRECCAHKTNVMYMYVRNMDVAYFCDYYPLANEVGKGYSNATVRPSFRNILVNTLESTSFNEFWPNLERIWNSIEGMQRYTLPLFYLILKWFRRCVIFCFSFHFIYFTIYWFHFCD